MVDDEEDVASYVVNVSTNGKEYEYESLSIAIEGQEHGSACLSLNPRSRIY